MFVSKQKMIFGKKYYFLISLDNKSNKLVFLKLKHNFGKKIKNI